MRFWCNLGVVMFACCAAPALHASPILSGAYVDLNLAQLSAAGLNLNGQYSAATFRSSDTVMLATYTGAPDSTIYALSVTRLNGHVSGFSAVSQASTVVAHLSVNGRSVESMAYAPNGTLV